MPLEILIPLLVLVITLIGGVIGFFVSRFFSSKDKVEEKLDEKKESETHKLETIILKIDGKLDAIQTETRTLIQAVATMDATVKAAWKSIDEMKADFREMRKRQDRFQETLR